MLQGCIATFIAWLTLAGSAWAAFPYHYDGAAPNDLVGKTEWMYAATPEPGNTLVNADPRELGGVRGASLVDGDPSVRTAWQTTTGRPDVTIAVLDSGIKWNDLGAMKDLRAKFRLNKGELEQPSTTLRKGSDPSAGDCSSYADAWDANGDGVFNTLDYACDSRVDPAPPLGDGPVEDGRPLLDPQDVLIAFTDGADDDGNGFDDDVVGWDFLDDDNDPFDDVQYGHGTGEARDSTAEADNGGELGTCPNCMSIPLRVGDSFIADESDFAQAVLYATDNGVRVVQEALGTLDHTSLGRDAVEYAYRHDVAVIASAADEAAQHHNWPSNEPHTIVVNSVTKYDESLTAEPRSYLQFNGCTNFSSKISVAIPSVSCSSDATGRAAGMAGLLYSAALERGIELSANEVRQLLTGTADDVNFAATELSCSPVPLDPCTDPNLNSVNPTRLVAPFPATVRYPARRGHDWFYGYGRVNMANAVGAVADGRIPPEAEITAPDWYSLVDPGRESLDVRGEVSARSGGYRCVLEVAPGSMPNNSEDFEPVTGGHCDGSERSGDFAGVVGSVDVGELRRRFPPSAGDFTGREPGVTSGQSSNGRPNSEPYGFTLRLRVESGGPARRGSPQPVPAPRLGPPAGLPAHARERRRGFAELRRPRRRQPQRVDRGDRRRDRARLPPRRHRGGGLAGSRRAAPASHRWARVRERLGVAGRKPRGIPRVAGRGRPRPRRRARGCGRRLRGPAVRVERRRHAALDPRHAPRVVGAAASALRRSSQGRAQPHPARLHRLARARRPRRRRPARGGGRGNGPPRLRLARRRRGAGGLPGARGGPLEGGVDRPGHPPGHVQRAGGRVAHAGRHRGHARRGRPHRRRPPRDRARHERGVRRERARGGRPQRGQRGDACSRAGGRGDRRAEPGALARLRARPARPGARRLAREDRQADRGAAAGGRRGHHRLAGDRPGRVRGRRRRGGGRHPGRGPRLPARGRTEIRASGAGRTARTAWSTPSRPRGRSRTRRPSRRWAIRHSAASTEASRSWPRPRACAARSTRR